LDDLYAIAIILNGLRWIGSYKDDRLSYVEQTLMYKGLYNVLGSMGKMDK